MVLNWFYMIQNHGCVRSRYQTLGQKKTFFSTTVLLASLLWVQVLSEAINWKFNVGGFMVSLRYMVLKMIFVPTKTMFNGKIGKRRVNQGLGLPQSHTKPHWQIKTPNRCLWMCLPRKCSNMCNLRPMLTMQNILHNCMAIPTKQVVTCLWLFRF